MPRPKQITRSRKLTLMLPEDKLLRLEIFLTSTVTGQVPQGAWQSFFVERIDEFFAKAAANVAAAQEESPNAQP